MTPYTTSAKPPIQTGNIGIGAYKEQGFKYVSEETFHQLSCTEISAGDVLICRLDGPVGRACLAPNLPERMITSVDNVILKPSEDQDSRFLVYVLSCSAWLDWIAALCRVGGGFRLRVSRTMLGSFKIPVPPFDEQKEIADFLDNHCSGINRMIEQIQISIDKLKEYRTAMISEAVTGKVQVLKEVAV